ncbi:MAG: ABC transporter ATP-binding protein [Dolichospermum sp. BR01]|nr:ABC transporter ATP-binding protein [Dolichospermum sp. BR01]
MSDTVIRVENLGKKYIIGHQKQERYTALRDVITNKVKSIGSLINPKEKVENPAFEEFWALKDVSFDIKQGDRVGIIGRNGAGKSTLLKILSRITEPTKGSIKIKGRVASLLEVGTGFHPELTGRENIFLNGAILGMGKEEIKRKFDEIVAFAEVEKFLDTPVKRYSSGMYVRLAFAVAAHLEPEILIVDEVLAVGDAQFQKKCLGKMEDVGKEGRTVLFVSHNMAAIEALCSTGILLINGILGKYGESKSVVKEYFAEDSSANRIGKFCWPVEQRPENSDFILESVCLIQNNVNVDTVEIFNPFKIDLILILKNANSESEISIEILDSNEVCVLLATSAFCSKLKDMQSGKILLTFYLPAYTFNTGTYSLSIASDIPNHKIHYRLPKVLMWDIENSCKTMSRYAGNWPGYLGPGIGKWDVSQLN